MVISLRASSQQLPTQIGNTDAPRPVLYNRTDLVHKPVKNTEIFIQ